MEATGPHREHVAAFLRRAEGRSALIAVPRFLTALVKTGEAPLGPDVWQTTALVVPAVGADRSWRNLFAGEELRTTERNGQAVLPLAEVFAHFPVALLLAQE